MNNLIRTRFAPSPTGFLHVGGLRTALYNYLFAHKNSGIMVLRIEDTDRSRYVEGAVENLMTTLHTMGISYDEGPDLDGKHAPYFQSQRLKLYQEHAQQLIDSHDAYYCFCAPERLEKMRKAQEVAGQQSKYDGTCRGLSGSQVQENLSKKLPHVVRLKMPETGESKFSDLIRGEVSVQNELVDDQILIKSDGFPTYHLANVIDDHFMEISHVIRGEEWLLSVPKHLRLYEAFSWTPPEMAHLPLLLNPDRSKLSKRQGDVAVEDFLIKGYLPAALNNFVALLGWNPGTDQEIFTMAQLIDEFSLERVNKSGAVFDLQKLNWMNSQYIRQLPETERRSFLVPYFKKFGYSTEGSDKTGKIVDSISKRISFGDEVKNEAAIFFTDSLIVSEEESRDILQKESARTVLKAFLDKTDDFTEVGVEEFKSIMKEVQEQTGFKKEELWMPIRVALTGVNHGPDLPLVIEMFGKNKIQNFIKQALNLN
jgi:glutamyl-tRNA synthetase